MYTEEELNEKLKQFLKTEIEAVWFYTENLADYNYKENEKAVNILLLDSISHMKKIVETYLEINKDIGVALTPRMKEEALREEKSMIDIYEYVKQRTDNKKVKQLLKELIEWEEQHVKVAEGLR